MGAAPAAPRPVDAKAQGFPARPAASPSTSGTSTAFGGRPAPSNAINNLGRVSQKPEARPLSMGGSVPGRQVNSTMMAARSSNMQGRPAGSPTQAVNVNRQVTSTGNPNVAGGTAPVKPGTSAPSTGAPQNRMDVVRQAQQQRKQDARVQAVSRPGGTTPTQSAPVRPGDKVPGEKVATNSQLTGQAMARKGFGNDAGGGNYPAARQKPRPETDSSIGNPMGDYNPGQDNSTPTTTKSQSQLNTEPNVNTTDKPTAGIPPKPTTKPARTAPQTQTQKPGVVKKPNVPVKPIRKPQAAGTQNNMTAAQRAQQNRRVERGNARPGEKTIGLGIKSGKVTGKTARSNRPIGSSPLKEGMLNNKQLSEMIKTLRNKSLKEQNPKAEASSYRERQQFKPVHVSDPYNKKDQSPNDYMHRMAEGMQQSTLGPHRNRKMNPNSTTLGDLVSRNRGGNQSMNNRYESAEADLGSTETGKKGKEAETVSVNPTDNTPSATGSMNKNTKTTIKERKEK